MFHQRVIGGLVACLAAASTWAAEPGPSICVWDPIGRGGQVFDAARSYALAMQAHGVDITVKPYLDERVAAEDFKVGQCNGLLATSIRTKTYNAVTAAMDHGGAVTIVRDGQIDLDASYQVIQRAMQALASPAAEKLNVQDRFEIGGILPTGALYIMARDKDIFKRGFAGARMPAFDDDKVQAYLIARAGATPVSANIRNFVTLFNNGGVDVVFAPAVAYLPLEIYRGVGTKGGVSRFPLAFTSLQLVLDRGKFPQGFGLKSRQFWVNQFETVATAVRKAEASIPAQIWVDYNAEDAAKFVAQQRELRVELGKSGFYDKQGLKFMKRVRCSVHKAASECGSQAEIDW